MVSKNKGNSWTTYYNSKNNIISFTGGRTGSNLTLAFADRDSSICNDIIKYSDSEGESNIQNHLANCGKLLISKNNENFIETKQVVGDFVSMAENDANTIYVTGSKYWVRQYGTKIWKSTNAGDSFSLMLHQYNWDTGIYTVWDEKNLERSAVALDVEWDDSGYVSFDVNLRDSSMLGGGGGGTITSVSGTSPIISSER